MFIMSMKVEKRKVMTISIIIVALIVLLAVILMLVSKKGGENAAKKNQGLNAANNADRVAYLESFGWDVSDEPIEVYEIILPENLDQVYQKYNEIQKGQGMNLENYKGRRAKRWTYMVLNYPSDDEVHANMIICDNKIIAGDICSVALGGFIHGFTPEEAGAFSETDLLASDLPMELNGIEQQKVIQEDNEGITEQGVTSEGEVAEVQEGDNTQEAAINNGENDPAAVIDDIEQQTREEIEKSLEMLIQAAEDQNG